MSYRVLLGASDVGLVAEFQALALEAGDITVVDIAPTAGEVVATLNATVVDVIVLHEELGPLPVLDLAKNLGGRIPEAGLVLIAREQTATLTAAALRAGFRGIVGLPLALEDLQATVADAGAWAQAVRARFERGDDDDQDGVGRMLVLAGSKGGVGTTTLAVHLARYAASAGTARSVCLVDFDLQKGDVRSYLDLTHRRSVADLVDVAEDLSGRQIDESLYVAGDGLRILLPPPEGEFSDTVAGDAARRILGGIRSRFDIVIVDAGAVVSEGAAVAAAMADHVVVVVTPDVPALRAANRLLGLWERLQVRKEGVGILVNRVSRDGEIQQDLVGKVVSAPVLHASVPADFRALEAAANTGVPDRLEEGRVRRAIGQVAEELRIVPERSSRRTGRAKRRLRSQEGQVTAETVGMFFTMGLVLLLLWQLVLAGLTVVYAGHAAREAARELAVTRLSAAPLQAHLEEVVHADLPGGWAAPGMVRVVAGDARVDVTLTVPAIVPGAPSPIRLTSGAGTVREVAGWWP
jgi:pilus assembly protein CpaE